MRLRTQLTREKIVLKNPPREDFSIIKLDKTTLYSNIPEVGLLKRTMYTPSAPKPVGPYSQGICVDGWLFISGQIPIDPVTGELVKGDFKTQVERVLLNIKAIVEVAGGTLNNVVKVSVYLRDMNKLGEFNEVYSRFFTEDPPARSVVEVTGIPRKAELEVEAIARVEKCP